MGFRCHLSSDGRYAAFQHIAFSSLLRKNLEHSLSSLPKRFPEYSDLVPYNAPIRGDCSPVTDDPPSGVHAAKKAKSHPIVSEMSNEEAYEWQKARWAAMRALFPQPDSELFRGVTNLVVLNLAKCTPTKSRNTVGQFLLAKAREKDSPWFQTLLDTVPKDHRAIEQWASALEAKIEEDEREAERRVSTSAGNDCTANRSPAAGKL